MKVNFTNLITTYLAMAATYYVALYVGTGEIGASVVTFLVAMFFCPNWLETTKETKE